MKLRNFRNSGDLFLPTWLKDYLETYIIGSDTTLFYITIWSILHFISGTIVANYFIHYTTYTLYTSTIFAFVIHTIWELWQYITENTPHNLRGYIDMTVDTVLYMLGYGMVAKNKL